MAARVQLTADLFDFPQAPTQADGSLDCTTELRMALCAAIDSAPGDRHSIAARMSDLTGSKITKAMLDAWTAESKTQHRFPFEFAAALEAACGPSCAHLQDLLARKRGRAVLSGDELLLAKLGLIQKQKQDLDKQERAIKRHLRRGK